MLWPTLGSFAVATVVILSGCTSKLDPDVQEPQSGLEELLPARMLPANFLGIELGKPLDVPMCEQGGGFTLPRAEQPRLPCSHHPRSILEKEVTLLSKPIRMDSTIVLLGHKYSEVPVRDEILVTVNEGVVRSATATCISDNQEACLKVVQSILGAPASVRRDLKTVHAQWRGSNLSAVFIGKSPISAKAQVSVYLNQAKE